mgnify:CR=1 FL=1
MCADMPIAGRQQVGCGMSGWVVSFAMPLTDMPTFFLVNGIRNPC